MLLLVKVAADRRIDVKAHCPDALIAPQVKELVPHEIEPLAVIEPEVSEPHVIELVPHDMVPLEVTELQFIAPQVIELVPHDMVPLEVTEVHFIGPQVKGLPLQVIDPLLSKPSEVKGQKKFDWVRLNEAIADGVISFVHVSAMVFGPGVNIPNLGSDRNE